MILMLCWWARKNLSINFIESKKKVYIIMVIVATFNVIIMQISKFKGLDNKLPCLFCLGSVSKDSTKDKMRAITLIGVPYDI